MCTCCLKGLTSSKVLMMNNVLMIQMFAPTGGFYRVIDEAEKERNAEFSNGSVNMITNGMYRTTVLIKQKDLQVSY